MSGQNVGHLSRRQGLGAADLEIQVLHPEVG